MESCTCRTGSFIRPDDTETLSLHCNPLKAAESQQTAAFIEIVVNVPHSAFCSSECKTVECDILCISFVTTAQSHGSTFCLLFRYLLTVGLLWSQESTCCNLFVRIEACFSGEWTSFCKKTQPSIWNVELWSVLRVFISDPAHSERISLLSDPSGWCLNCNLQLIRSHTCVWKTI